MHTGFGNDGGLFLYRGASNSTSDTDNFKFILENDGKGSIIKSNNVSMTFLASGNVGIGTDSPA